MDRGEKLDLWEWHGVWMGITAAYTMLLSVKYAEKFYIAIVLSSFVVETDKNSVFVYECPSKFELSLEIRSW
jgi:hypothetical protein